MADTMLKLADGPCPVIAADVFVAPVKTSVISIDISNPTAFTQSVTLKMNGATLFSVDMPARGGVSYHGAQVLELGQAINLVANSNQCNYNISGVEII